MPKNAFPSFPGQVQPVRGPDHAVPEPVSDLELDRDERRARVRVVVLPAVGQDVLHHRGADEQRQELVHDDPLVVPGDDPPGLLEQVPAEPVVLQPLHHRIVEPDERGLQAGDDRVLVVAGVGDHRHPVAHPGHVLEQPAGLDPQPDVVRLV
jgi:hypothetical protein